MWGLWEEAAGPSSHQPVAPRCSPAPRAALTGGKASTAVPTRGAAAPPPLGVARPEDGLCSVPAWLTHRTLWGSSRNPSREFIASPLQPSHPLRLWMGLWSLSPAQHPNQGRTDQNCGAKTAPPAPPLPKGHEDTKVVFRWFETNCLVPSTGQGLGPGMEATDAAAAALPRLHPGSSWALWNPEALQPQNSLRAFISSHISKLENRGKGAGNKQICRETPQNSLRKVTARLWAQGP